MASSSASKIDYTADCLDVMLPSYYGRIFPGKLMYQWLSYGKPEFFARREFSYTLAGDIYVRYQSFSSAEEFVGELKKRRPIKIDIGGVYNQRPKTRDTLKEFIPLQKEFVLDIDLTDYDEIRTCCDGAKVCSLCWKFIAIAVKILDTSLRLDFGFQDILWVYSGRRGVHCWICDDVALKMDSYARSAILDYYTVIRGGENQIKKVKIVNPDRVHDYISRSIRIIDDVFEEICRDDQKILEKGNKCFDILPVEVKNATANAPNRFDAVMSYLKNNQKEKKSIRSAILELKLQLCYPRLDYNVSKDLNHLLKSPFCIHPKTGQICVPFDPDMAFNFKPSEVPSIITLMEELREIDKAARSQEVETQGEKASTGPLSDEAYEKTSLAPYMKVFRSFVQNLEKNRRALKKQGSDKFGRRLIEDCEDVVRDKNNRPVVSNYDF